MYTAITIYLIIGITLTFSELFHIPDSRNNLAKESVVDKILIILLAIISYPGFISWSLTKMCISKSEKTGTKDSKEEISKHK